MGKKHGFNIKYEKNGEILIKIYYEEDIKNGYRTYLILRATLILNNTLP